MILRSPQTHRATGAVPNGGTEMLGHDRNCIAITRTRHAECALATRPLMLVAARGGRELYTLDRRRLMVDDDNFLVLNEGRAHASLIRSETEVESCKISFRAGMVAEVLAPLVTTADRLLEREAPLLRFAFEFCESLQPHDRLVSPGLRYIRQHALAGNDDKVWFEEQLAYLLERLLFAHREIVRKVHAVPCARSGTRKEIHRRVTLAVDYIESCYEQPIELEMLAQVACMSKFHFLRAFRSLLGMTPQAYWQRKRAFVAQRLLATTALPAADIALQVGYASRTSLTKQVRLWTGVPPGEFRRRVAVEPDAGVVNFATA